MRIRVEPAHLPLPQPQTQQGGEARPQPHIEQNAEEPGFLCRLSNSLQHLLNSFGRLVIGVEDMIPATV